MSPAQSRALLPAACVLLAGCLAGRPPWLGDDYAVVLGGAIYPAADAAPVEALLIEDGRVRALGTRAEIEAEAASVVAHAADFDIEVVPRRIDLAGGTAVPGLVDAHGHLEGPRRFARERGPHRLPQPRRADRARGRARRGAAARLLGRRPRLGPDALPRPGVPAPRGAERARAGPSRCSSSASTATRPSPTPAAFELAGLLGRTGALPEVEGGRIVVDEQGAPTGVLVDMATALVADRIPAPDGATRTRRLLAAQQALLACGLTGMHDMGTSPETLAALEALERDGKLALRVTSYLWANEGLGGFGRVRVRRDLDAKLRVIGAKLMVDGALGSRGAALLEPYSDAPGETGLLQMSAETYAARLAEALAAGLQPATHAIGDRGNRMVLDAYAAALARDPGLAALRPRVEHAQIVARADWPRFEELGVIPSMQPTHATSDMRWAEARLGRARIAGAYAWRRLAGAHAPLALGSDFPVESANPLLGLYAARTRQDASGNPEGGWLPDQRLSGAEALAGFTTGAAYAAHEEERRGKLLPGFAADLTVLSVDPIHCEPRALLDARVLATIVDGELAYSALPSAPPAPAPIPAN
jgi:predicted amidohydrolase YtcJ